MKHSIKVTLSLISVFILVCEFFYGIPFLGGMIIFSYFWQPLLFNAFLYLVLVIILLFDKQNAIKPMLVIPLIGIVGSLIAILPIIGMITHWILFFLMVSFLFIVLSAPTYLPNKNARVVYTQYKDDKHENR